MSVDTNLFFPFTGKGNKPVLQIVDATAAAIRDFTGLKGHMTIEYGDFTKMFSFYFKDGEDDRILRLHLDCDQDCPEIYDGPKVIYTIGCWGRSVELMDHIARFHAFTWLPLERPWIRKNDCEGDWERVI